MCPASYILYRHVDNIMTGPSVLQYNAYTICMQAFSQKGVQAYWDAPRTKSGRLWTPKFWGEREIILNDFSKYINISETN
jgi:hypothetical protein